MVYGRLSPRVWLILGTLLSIIGYFSLFLVKFIPIGYISICQVISGIISGYGAGIGMVLLVITPQTWLDKTRKKFSPYIFLGASIICACALPLGKCPKTPRGLGI